MKKGRSGHFVSSLTRPANAFLSGPHWSRILRTSPFGAGGAAPDRSWLSRVGSPHTHVSHKAVSSPRPGRRCFRHSGLWCSTDAGGQPFTPLERFVMELFRPRAAKSLPLADIEAGAVKPQDIVEEARVTVHVHPRRRHRHRHWRCWCHWDVACVASASSACQERPVLAQSGPARRALLRPLLTQSRHFVSCWSLRDFVFE